MEQDIKLIEDYLNGDLSPEDRSMVSNRLKEDSVFARRFEIIRGSQLALDPEIELFESDLKSVQNEYQSASETLTWWRKSYGVAAVLLIVSTTFLGYLFWFQNPSSESLYLSYLEAPPNNISVRGQLTDEQLIEAMEAYDQQNYALALEHLQQVLEVEPDHYGALFYTGVCYLLLEQYQSSLSLFQSLTKTDSNEYYTAAKWYLSLNLLKLDQIAKAKSELQQLQQMENGNYSRLAEKLLNEIK
ncbi:MAG: hypothetical protein DHS20C17_27640 [Cyclobacteriaceae bacterium]|nr:MAG: hypothetical protein DHS20C17_27640 [Cyclobacteriaceae bacterium]